MAGKVNIGVPSPRHSQSAYVHIGGFSRGITNGYARDTRAAACRHDLRTTIKGIIAKRRRIAARIDDGGKGCPRGLQGKRVAMSLIRADKQRDFARWQDAVAVEIGSHCACHHNGGAVIVCKCDGPFNSACGQNRSARSDAPETFAWHSAIRGVLKSHALDHAIGATIIGPRDCATRHDPHIGHGRKLGRYLRKPSLRRHIVNRSILKPKPAAEFCVLVNKDHIRARLGRDKGGSQARRASANDQKITMSKGLFRWFCLHLAGQAAQTRCAADQGFVNRFPKAARPHECFVVKPRA